MKKIYSICALVGMVFFSDACWGGAFMDALKKIGENSAVRLGDGFFWFDGSKAKDSNQKKRFKDTRERWEDNCESWDNVDVGFYPSGLCHAPYLRIGSYKILGAYDNDKFTVLDRQDHQVRDRSIFQRYTVTEENGGTHVVIKDTGDGFHLDFYWGSNGTVVIKDASVKSIAIHANFVHFLGDNHFGKATIAAYSGCTFWGSNTIANNLKIYSHSIAKLEGFLGGVPKYGYARKILTESELDDFVTSCPDYMKWLERYVYGSDVGFLNIGGRFETDEVKTEDISFNIDGNTKIKKSLTQSGKNNKTIIRSRGDLAPIALQWLAYFTPDDDRYSVDIEKFIGTKAIKIAKEDNIGYSETIKNTENFSKSFYCNSYINLMGYLRHDTGDKLEHRNVFKSFEYENGDPVNIKKSIKINVPTSVRYNDRENLWFKQQSKKKYQFWFKFNKLPIYYGPEANSRLNALLNYQISGIKKIEPEVAPASSADGDKNDDNEVAEPEVAPVSTSSNNNKDDSGESPIIGMPGADHALGVNREWVNKVNQEQITPATNQQTNSELTQNSENHTPPEENTPPISQVDFSEEEMADDEDEGEFENK